MLERYKSLYCIAVMAVGTLLAFFGGVIGWLAAVLILSSALPAWRAVIHVAETSGAYRALDKIWRLTNEETDPTVPDHQEAA